MTTFLSLFEVGALGFWLIITLLSIIVVVGLETEKFVFSSIVTAVVGLLYWKTLATQNWTTGNIIALVAFYALAGAVWSIYRWYRHVQSEITNFKEKKGDYLYGTDSDKIAEVKRNTSVSRNKAIISAWIAYWPWSFAWNIFGDIFNSIYDAIKGVYQNITAKALASIGVSLK
jgi:hypothetical protein